MHTVQCRCVWSTGLGVDDDPRRSTSPNDDVISFIVSFTLSQICCEVTKMKLQYTMRELIEFINEPMISAALRTILRYSLNHVKDDAGKGTLIYVKVFKYGFICLILV